MTLREGPYESQPCGSCNGFKIADNQGETMHVYLHDLPTLRRLLEKLEGRRSTAPVKCDYGDKCPGHASPHDRPCGWKPAKPTKGKRRPSAVGRQGR